MSQMIGYLYAIKQGAKYIWDAEDIKDDDFIIDSFAEPFPDILGEGEMYEKSILLPKRYGNETAFNPYKHFGQPDLWPRGFPPHK